MGKFSVSLLSQMLRQAGFLLHLVLINSTGIKLLRRLEILYLLIQRVLYFFIECLTCVITLRKKYDSTLVLLKRKRKCARSKAISLFEIFFIFHENSNLKTATFFRNSVMISANFIHLPINMRENDSEFHK